MLQALLNQVKNAIFNDPMTPHRQGYDPSGLIGQIEGMFGQHQEQMQQGGVRPASEDPLGDPADQEPFAQPYGQPYNQRYVNQPGGNYGYLGGQNVRPASEDPLGDPADQEGR
jgi:hypothetical protein